MVTRVDRGLLRGLAEAARMLGNSQKIAKECRKNSEGWVEQKVDGDSKAAGCRQQDDAQDKTDG